MARQPRERKYFEEAANRPTWSLFFSPRLCSRTMSTITGRATGIGIPPVVGYNACWPRVRVKSDEHAHVEGWV